MGRIQVLTDKVANQIAAGEVVERPASIVKELLENSLDAGATRIRVDVEAGGKKLIQVVDNGCGMVRDDALLCFERHATSKIKHAEDLLQIATLGFRGEALPSIASVSRLRLETCAARDADAAALSENKPTDLSGTVVEIHGGRILKVEEAGLPLGTSIRVQDLFFNLPARKKFLKAESTELSHIASLVTHYALAHPEMHFELHSATHAMLMAPPVASHGERIYQVFGKETLDQLLPVAAMMGLQHAGLPQPPPWRREEDYEAPIPGELRLHGFVSRPEVQKLNRNSIYIFVNGRLIRDRLVQHALTEAYRNILPPTVYPIVLLFLEMPPAEVDVNVHPSKTEVRFRQQSAVHDFVRDSVRGALMMFRPVAQFGKELVANPSATAGLSVSGNCSEPPENESEDGSVDPTQIPQGARDESGAPSIADSAVKPAWGLNAPPAPPHTARLPFSIGQAIDITANAAIPVARGALPTRTMAAQLAPETPVVIVPGGDNCASAILDEAEDAAAVPAELHALGTLKPLGQVKESFILAVNREGLWIIDQHVAHERVLFEKIQKQRAAKKAESQRLLMPLLVELTPAQQAVFAEIAGELADNGFDVEPFGARTLAVKVVPAGLDASEAERMLRELLEQVAQIGSDELALNMEMVRNRIAASIACHAAIKVNMPLTQDKMEWLLRELALTEYPMTCPHGRPVVLRYSVRDIERAFKRI